MATTSYGTPMVSSTMPNTTGMSTAPSTITITSPMVSSVMPVTPRLSSRAPLPMTQTQTSTMTSTPMVSTVMANPVVPTQTTSTPMTSTGTSGPLVNRNMGLPLSSARPIEVTETTSNLEEIQNFPVIGRVADGTHFHQDPVSGQVYRMTEEFHQRIPEILNRKKVISNSLDSENKTVPLIRGNRTISMNDDLSVEQSNQNDFNQQRNYYKNSRVLFNELLRSSNDLIEIYSNGVVENSTPILPTSGRNLNVGMSSNTTYNRLENVLQTNESFEIGNGIVSSFNTNLRGQYVEPKNMVPINTNTFVNDSTTKISEQNRFYFSIPLNSFINRNDFFQSSIERSNVFIPINRFINK